MKNKYFRRFIVMLLVISMMLQYTSQIAMAYVNEGNTIRGYNPFIEYLLDKNDGRFIIRTVGGVPQKSSDDNQKLLFERDNDPETSFTTFRIDGKDYIFGNAYGNKSGHASDYTTTSDGLLTISNWKFDGLEVKQTLEIIEDPEHPNVGNVRVRYDVTNKSGKTREVGNRIMLDTQLGSNDGTAFYVGDNTISTETALTGDKIPDYYRTSDDEFAPNVIGYGFLIGWGQDSPDKVVFAHFNTLSESKWEVNLDSNLDFTSDGNKYSGADSAVAYYFNEKPLGANQTRTFETFYGIGDFSNYNSNSTYAVLVNAPDKLTVNDTKNDYNEDTITVSVTIDNSLPDSENLTGVNISLVKRDFAFADVDGENYSLDVPLIEKGAIKTYEFKLSPVNQDQYISEPIKAVVTSDNSSESNSSYDYVLMPNINGERPELTIDTVSPNTIYYKGYREFSLTGKGFNMLTNKGLWELYLVDSSGNEIEIPDECVSISSDEKLSITLYDDSISSDTPAGNYIFMMEHSDLGTITTPWSKAITFSSDIKYKSRKYGVLYVEKEADGDSYKYDIGLANSTDELSTLKETKDIIFDIVGDVVEVSDENDNKSYKVKTDQQDAIINSVVKYKDADTPMEIKKTGDLITVDGDGTLQIVGSSEFWWWKFYTYIADGEDYVTDQIIEDSDEEDDALFDINPEWVPEDEDDTEGKSNVVIDFFNPINAIGAVVNTFYDGFNIEIGSVVLLDEGASFSGSMEIEVPFGAEVPVVESDEELSEEEMDNLLAEGLADLFLTDAEREKKYKDKEANDARRKASNKIRAILLSDDGMAREIYSLISDSSETPASKAMTLLNVLLKSPDLVMTIYSAIKGKPQEDDPDRKSVGVSINVKKVLFGKKYKDDFFYDSVKYIGLDAEGEVNVTLPFGSEEDREEHQGVSAYASINTIDNEYTFSADVDLELCEAHVIVSIVKVGNDLKPDHIELSGGFTPGVPLTPPIFINKVGGGVKNLQSKSDDEPLTIIMILGLAVQPAMEGDFRVEASKNGFSMQGSFELKGGMEIFKEAYVALQWVHPVYFAAGATVDLFDIIEGSASLYIGEIPVKDGGYKFYFEGKVKVDITVPKNIWLVGGKQIGGAELGVSTEKIWGSVKVIGIGVGITYVYGNGIRFSDSDEEFALENLTDVKLPENAIYKGQLVGDDGSKSEGTFIVGSNITIVGSTDTAFVSSDISDMNLYVVMNDEHTSYDFNVDNQDNAIFEIGFTGDEPNLTLTDPNGNDVPLVENENYMIQVIPAEDSPSGEEEKYAYISVVSPINGTYTVNSDKPLETGTMYDAKSLPELTSLDFTTDNDNIDVNFTSVNNEDALVSLFLVDNTGGSEYALASNIPATDGSATCEIPANLPEGEYYIRASIQNPSYSYDDMTTTKTLTIVDADKPTDITELKVTNVGNGQLEATWSHEASDDEIDYYTTVYDLAGNVVDGFANLKTTETKLYFGGDYTGVDADGNDIDYKIDYNKSYVIGVTPVKHVVDEDGTQTLHVGNETRSAVFVKKEPNPPNVIINYLDSVTYSGGETYLATDSVSISYSADQLTDTDIYVDGEYYMSTSDKKKFNLSLNLEDGEHGVEFRSINSSNDTTVNTIGFITDTMPPQLMIDSPATSVISDDGSVSVMGACESGSKVYIGNEEISTDENGQFNTTYNMDLSKIKESITISAIDNAGNKTDYNAEIINGTVKPIESIEIDSVNQNAYTGSTMNLIVTGTDEEGKKVQLDNKDITFDIIKGDTLGTISDNGQVTFFDKGEMTLLASYSLTDDYALSDAVNISVESGIDELRILPEISEIEEGKTVSLSAVAQSKYSESKLDNKYITYSILDGSEYAALSGNTLTAKSAGSVTIKANYDDGKMTAQATMTFTISKSKDRDNDSKEPAEFFEAEQISAIDSVLNGIWENLVEREKGLEIISVRAIDHGINTRVTLLGIGSLDIPMGTVDNNDYFLSGIIKNGEGLIDKDLYQLNGNVHEFSFKNAGGRLQNDITLRLKFDSSQVTDTDKLGIYVYNEIFGKWEYVGGTIEGDELVVNLKHLSKYSVLENVNGQSFMDINNYWAKSYIMALKSLDVVEGTNSGGYYYYSPDKNLTRLELAALTVRVYEKLYTESVVQYTEGSIDGIFEDSNQIPEWGKEYAYKAYKYGLVKGNAVGGKLYFDPNKNTTRAETMTILGRAINESCTDTYSFTDESTIPSWANEYINLLVKLGLVDGYSDGSIKPLNNITRGEMAKLLYYWIDNEVIERK